MGLIDSDQRSQATNPHMSFIVQAPAGSGKTEILTQRYLRLLGTVTAPEQILALTFTRKAASEMRARIMLALQQAANQQPASSTHQQMTLTFAQKALERSQEFQWNLLTHSSRLKISTIDALCQNINQSIPLLEKQIAYATISDTPASHYLTAARGCIQFALETPQYQEAISTLLLHVDNKQEHLLALLTNMLAQRDQWLNPLFEARAQDKSTFENALRYIEDHELIRFKNSAPLHLAEQITQLARELALIENNPDSPRYILRTWFKFNQITRKMVTALAKMLLTGEQQFRSAFDHHIGLKRGVCSDLEYTRLKEESKQLLAQLNECPDFHAALLQVSHLPEPEYDEDQWQVLQALFLLLPLLLGHLHLLFGERNEVDFTEMSQQALNALGDADNPTDLSLYLDNALHHVLVDEFQDTSINQFELISRLVQGWQPDEGKTLFIVGDPMQSIYRFRQAEVGLFFRAQEQGIGSVMLHSLKLHCNFRTTESLVNWVNHHFSNLFPRESAIESGAVSFHASTAVIKKEEHSLIKTLQCKDKEHEAHTLVQLITDELQNHPDRILAILVRSRTHLTEIIRLLRQHQIPYQGTDIDLLANLMHLRDVWSLTQALLSPANRLSWLAVLRSPYCGLSLTDLHTIANFNKKQSIYYALLNLDSIEGISEEGRIRSAYFIQVMHSALANRCQTRLSVWVGQTLKALKIEHILNQNQLNDLEQLWVLLDRYEHEGRLPDMQEFVRELTSLYSQQAVPSRLQVMTIHKSKGLEFDTVFLPGAGSQPRRSDSPMLRWLKLPTEDDTVFLVSPVQAADQETCALYDYLGRLDDEKSRYESQRLLYVAVTRAKSRLYLLDSSSKSSKGSFRSLLKTQEFVDAEPSPESDEKPATFTGLMKLPLSFYTEYHSNFDPVTNTPSYGLVNSIPRLTGVVTHQLLQWICDNHPGTVEQVPWNLATSEFRKLGFDTLNQQQALFILKKQITQLFQDPKGAWVIQVHKQEHNEYELLVAHQGNIVTRIIDRMFEYENKLWIIDFKTGKEETTLSQHQQQLNEYAGYLSSRTSLPIHCGLYYLANGHWVEWMYAVTS